MDEREGVIRAVDVEELERGEVECTIQIVTGEFILDGRGTVSRIEGRGRGGGRSPQVGLGKVGQGNDEDGKDRQRRSRKGMKVKRISPLVFRAVKVLVKAGFDAGDIEDIVSLPRRSAFEVVKRAKRALVEDERKRIEDEHNRKLAESAGINLAIRESWQERKKDEKEFVPFREIREFK